MTRENPDATQARADKPSGAGLKGIARKHLPFAILCNIAVILLETTGALRAVQVVEQACQMEIF